LKSTKTLLKEVRLLKLSSTIAQQIVARISRDIPFNINIMNENGIIIASGESSRTGTLHEGALKVIENGEPVTIYDDTFSGAKPGVNLPIRFDGSLVGVIGITGDPEKTAPFGAIVVSMTEVMLEQFYLMEENDWKTRTKGFLLDECLKSNPDVKKILHKARRFNWKLVPPFQLIVFHIKQPKITAPTSLYGQLSKRLSDFPGLHNFFDDEYFVILTTYNRLTLDSIKKIEKIFEENAATVRVGLSEPFEHLTMTKEKYARVIRGFSLTRKCHFYTNELQMQYVLDSADRTEAENYVEQNLSSLSSELRMTLKTFFDNNLNISKSAQALYIHRNTLIYRLDKIMEISGRDPRRFSDAWALALAFWLDCTKSEE
jgi:carbohydrate diacid regulator